MTSQKILVLDDDPDISMMLKLMFEFKGYDVNTAERPEELYELLDKNHSDLIIMDMLLSGANGIDVCSRLKNDTVTRTIPIMMISAHPNAREICLQAGADDFVAKPFDMNDMLARVGTLIRNREI
jgi:DNA-binding response OmpR family regulator